MGFHEDDRIRSKNFASNAAIVVYANYRSQLWSHTDIAAAAEEMLLKNPNNKVIYEVLKLALRSTNTDSDTSSDQD